MSLPSIEHRLAIEISAKPAQVLAAITLFDEGATVPFIARYRKEATGELNDMQLRLLEERLHYLRELEQRRSTIIVSINEQNKLKLVPRMGEKTFEQAAGFLRILGGDNPLDASAVHPESYPLVRKILADLKKNIKDVIGDSKLLKSLDPAKFADEKFGAPTIGDILRELGKPGRDPRPEFTTATFREGVEELKDLKPDMILEGVVTNVAAFGAFVDIGVHQDGLVHISALSSSFVKDPHSVVKAGQVVRVKVLGVDEKRKRITLTMRLTDSAAEPARGGKGAPWTHKDNLEFERGIASNRAKSAFDLRRKM